MEMDKTTIFFRGMPLFETATVKPPAKRLANMQNLACFFYILEGNYQISESNGAFRVGKREALIKKCGNYTAHFIKGENDEDVKAVAVYLYPDLLHEIYKNEVPAFLGETPSKPRVLLPNELIDKYISNLFVYFDNPDMIDEALAKLKLKELVMLLLRSDYYESVQKFLAEIFSPNKLRFTSIIENNLYTSLSMEELAFICNRSLSSFKRDFKKEFGETPARYIKKRRLERAAQLLTSTEDSISGIAFECGFQDASTFSASFQEKYGMSASEYRSKEKVVG
ncbi:MAG: hypothetical protein CL840_16345 [Crocinitomicaceae bacterium]|nr:hypothetical protein [Crocinitomicaceae bacterium]|tara:strand:+ start:366 stop:1208 length:843 start_codon:yes stop_codon:yes gene_type:complete